MGWGATRVGQPPWRGKHPCPQDPWNHCVLPDSNGNATFHYTASGIGLPCEGVGKPLDKTYNDGIDYD